MEVFKKSFSMIEMMIKCGLLDDKQIYQMIEKCGPRPDTGMASQMVNLMVRDLFVQHFSWFVPSKRSVDFMVGHIAGRQVIEVCSGNGLLAFLLQRAGVTVLPSDLNPPDMTYTTIEKCAAVDYLKSMDTSDKVLLMCWVPYQFPDYLPQHFAGDTIIYIGEDQDGCTGSYPGDEWREIASDCDKQWWGIHDSVQIFKRR